MTLSICLIVKNEEKVLGRCLENASKIADELIVVDTGSEDHSVEIAMRYTPKIYKHAWQNDFSEARNYAFSLAHCEYVMWLDADDVIDDENISRFLKLKKELDMKTDVVFTIYGSYTEDGLRSYILRDRIIKRELNPKFVGEIHEAIPILPSWNCKYKPDIAITHKKEYVNEPTRNMDIFKMIIRKNRQMSDFEKANYCKELVVAKQYKKAYDVFNELKHTASNIDYYYGMYFLAPGLIENKQYEDCIKEIEELERKNTITAYMIYHKGICYEKLGCRDEAEKSYLRALSIPEDPTTLYPQKTGYDDYFPLLRLAELTARIGNEKKALVYVNKAAKAYPRNNAWKNTKINVLLLSTL